MPTKEHTAGVISDLDQFFVNGKVAIVADLSGYTVAELTHFRRSMDKAQAKVKVTKNTLVKIASKNTEFESIEKLAKGPTTVVVGYEDPAAPAKAVVEAIKSLKKGAVKGGVLEGRCLTSEEVKGLADLPSKEQLLASIMGGLDSGARGIAGIFEGLIRDIALLTEEVAKKNNNA